MLLTAEPSLPPQSRGSDSRYTVCSRVNDLTFLNTSFLISRGKSWYRLHCGWVTEMRDVLCSAQVTLHCDLHSQDFPSLPAQMQSEPRALCLMENKGFFGVSPLTSLLQPAFSPQATPPLLCKLLPKPFILWVLQGES